MPLHRTPVHQAAADAVAAVTGVAAGELKVEATPRPELGDLAVGCFAIAKARKQSPAVVAAEIAAAFRPTALLASATAAGPFVNFRIDRAAAFAWLIAHATTDQLLPRSLGANQTICIDYGSPNISKHLAYHHIRGTAIGHSLAQIYRALGYRVVGINFLGDWGTTHGMLLAAYALWGAPEPLDITALNGLYTRFRKAMETDPSYEQQGRAWFKRLEDGDPEARALWQRFRDVSWTEFQAIYDLLGIVYDEVRGEAAYEPDMPRVIAELTERGLLVTSDGAQVVELEGEKTPILIKTRDGTTLYATRDIAAAEYRWEHYEFARSLYVVDRGQALHFRQLFKLLAKMDYDWASRCEHVPYGLVRVGGKRIGNRLGGVTMMRTVFEIAEADVRKRMTDGNTELSPEVVAGVARQVGIGAVVFANLVQQRDKDIDFDIDKATALDGDSGPYLQYSHARCAAIVRKAGGTIVGDVDGTAPPSGGAAGRGQAPAVDTAKLTHDTEWAIARRLLEFADIVVRAGDASEPHVICHYLLDLAGEFSRWYTAGNGDPALRVLCDDPATRGARLALVAAVQATLARGLGLLGLAAPDQM